MALPTQLPLALPHAPSLAREDFVSGASNEAALRLVEAWPDWPSPVALLIGPAGSGKTHLVHIWAARAGAEIVPADALGYEGALNGFASGKALAVEDVASDAVPERALFHLINSVREHGGFLLMTAQEPPDAWRVTLPDLRSRLRLATPARLGPPEDERPVIDFLLLRMERSLSAAARLVDALDRTALSAGRRITRAMAAEVLAEGEGFKSFADRQ
jgi:chromosomal replication initiation ATPase DnaA